MASHVVCPPPTLGASRKRKECEPSETARVQVAIKAEPALSSEPHVQPYVIGSNNRLLAGYLAHEFLTRGTLFGKQWEAERPEPAGSKKPNQDLVRSMAAVNPVQVKPGKSYADVSHLLMRANGAHVAGVVNPTQLARWLQM